MGRFETSTRVKVIDARGQISLGIELAGRKVLVEEREPGVWLIRIAPVVFENERWLHEPKAHDDLRRALQWARRNPPRESDPDAIVRALGRVRKRKRRPVGNRVP